MSAHERALEHVARIFPPPFTRPYGVVNEYLKALVPDDGLAVLVLSGGRVVELTDGVAFHQWAMDAVHRVANVEGGGGRRLWQLIDAAREVADAPSS